MSNPTSNFGWQMPTSTDLVTDLPADFEVFGQAVDTDFIDLLGGTTGQVLSKTSATDLDFTWVTAQVGDITGVTAGTGISGGGTSGTVTVTNDMATTITAAGDIVVGTGSGTYDNLPIGTTAQVLTADTTVSPYKVKWATPAVSTPSFTGVLVTKTATQNITTNTYTVVSYNSETYDVGGYHDNATNNSRLTVPASKAGYYYVFYTACYGASATNTRRAFVTLNGVLSSIFNSQWQVSASGIGSGGSSGIMSLSVADYIEIQTYQDSGGTLPLQNLQDATFGMIYLGA